MYEYADEHIQQYKITHKKTKYNIFGLQKRKNNIDDKAIKLFKTVA